MTPTGVCVVHCFHACSRYPDCALPRTNDVPPGTELLTSAYAAEEARRNLSGADQRARLEELLAAVRIVAESDAPLPSGVRLPDKDLPILRAAVGAGATHLLTGDFKDFGRYLGRRIAGVLVVTPADFIRS